MKIRELTQKAENLIEQGENAKQRQIHYQQQANSARAQVMSAYARLEAAASETDEEGNPIGDVSGARAEVYAAQALLESAEVNLAEANQQLEIVGRRKLDAVHEIERYENVEEGNMSKLAELQKKRFGANANAFMADLAARMNSGEQARQQLLHSMGMSAPAKSYSAGSAVGVGNGSLGNSSFASAEKANESGVKSFFGSLLGMRKKREFTYRQFGTFEIGSHGFVKGNNFEGYLNDWEGHDPTQFRTNMFDAPELRTINPSDIEGISLGDNDIADPAIFWSQHMTGGTENSFKEIAALIPEVQKELSMGRSLDDLIEDPRLGKCASLYFDPANMPEVIECDGYYEFQSNGRHRILAAREMGYDMPVKVIGTRNRITADGILNENMGKASVSTIHNTEVNAKKNSVIASTAPAYGFSARADFGNLDSRTSKDVFVAVAETKQMFPELNMQFIGSAQARNQAIENDLRKEYLSAYRRHYPGASDAELLPFVNQQVSEDMSYLHIENGTIAQSLYVPNTSSMTEDIIARYNGISINESYGSSYEHFKRVKQSDVDAGWKPINCNTPKATVDHELGHQVAKLVDAHNDPDINELFGRFSQIDAQNQSKVLSGYAATNIHEFIAESWSEYRNNPKCRDCAKFVATRMIELYEAKNPKKKKVLRRGC